MKKTIYLFAMVSILSVFSGCKKKPDQPPVFDASHNKAYSVAELKTIASCTNGCQKRFTADDQFVGVVIADAVSGNFYKEIYVRDRYNTGAIHLDFLASCNFFIGDSVRLNLKGYDVWINSTTGMLEIDSIDCEKNMAKFATGANPQPRAITLEDNYSNYLCDLVSICGVGFIPGDTNQAWADPITPKSLNHTLQSCSGSTLVVRTSNYASFALEKTPKGFGTIVGIATAYQGTNQLAIRKTAEVNMNGPKVCNYYLNKDFNDNSLTSGGWSQQSVTNSSVMWSASTYSVYNFAKISGYVSGNQNSENWLISPSMNLSSASSPMLSFRTAAKFSGTALQVLVSTDYNSGAPSTATWIPINGFDLSPNNPGSYAWTPSGSISLAGFKSANTRIAFRYISTTSGATTYELDDILVREICN